jgi:geranylgeranyl reductase family protein
MSDTQRLPLVQDVIIVGAGPAGSVLAFLLAKSGLRVLILEKSSLPRYKSCGGGLTIKTIQSLPFGVEPVVEMKAEGGKVFYKGEKLFTTRTEQPIAFLVMRDRFDYFLVQKAIEAGADLLEDVAVTGIEQDAQGVQVQTSKGKFQARFVVGADGVFSITARLVGLLARRKTGTALEAEVETPSAALESQGYYATFDFGATRRGYGWIFPKQDHLSVGVFRAWPGKANNIKANLESFLASQPVLRTHRLLRLKGHLIPLGGDFAPLHLGRVLLVGDAANLADPWLGEGIYYAVRSARIAADVICEALSRGQTDLAAYTRLVHQEIVEQLFCARRFAGFVYQIPGLASRLLGASPQLQALVFGVMRGDYTFQQLNEQVLRQAGKICLQVIRSGDQTI